MSVISTLVLYIVIWWIVFFIVLPIGNKPPSSTGHGNVAGAPEEGYIGIKALITTLLAFILFCLARYGIEQRWIALT